VQSTHEQLYKGNKDNKKMANLQIPGLIQTLLSSKSFKISHFAKFNPFILFLLAKLKVLVIQQAIFFKKGLSRNSLL
jgi:hypothetical protein